jgi:excisionase family DNA binding protein
MQHIEVAELATALELAEARLLASGGSGRVVREAAGLSLNDVGRACGVHASTILRWERGDRRPRGIPAALYVRLIPDLAAPNGGAAMTDLPLVLTVEEAAEVLRIGRTAAYEAVRRGELPSFRIGRSLRVPRHALGVLLGLENGDGAAADGAERKVTQGGARRGES